MGAVKQSDAARVWELLYFWHALILTVKAVSDDAFRRLLRYFVDFYREDLFNDYWGGAGAHCERQCARLIHGVRLFEHGRSK